MDTQELIQHYADKFSTNKATNRAYKKIFYLIYKLNVIDKQNNEYGFAEINFNLFKSISKRKYKEILIDLYMNGLIYTNISPKKNNTGRNKDGEKFTRAYKIDRSKVNVVDNENVLHFENVLPDNPVAQAFFEKFMQIGQIMKERSDEYNKNNKE